LGKGRLEAFTDGVMAIVITIMVLEIKVPQTLRPSPPACRSFSLMRSAS
jgi:uncharacterized membrane protein